MIDGCEMFVFEFFRDRKSVSVMNGFLLSVQQEG